MSPHRAKGQDQRSLGSKVGVETDGQTDRRTEAIALHRVLTTFVISEWSLCSVAQHGTYSRVSIFVSKIASLMSLSHWKFLFRNFISKDKQRDYILQVLFCEIDFRNTGSRANCTLGQSRNLFS